MSHTESCRRMRAAMVNATLATVLLGLVSCTSGPTSPRSASVAGVGAMPGAAGTSAGTPPLPMPTAGMPVAGAAPGAAGTSAGAPPLPMPTAGATAGAAPGIAGAGGVLPPGAAGMGGMLPVPLPSVGAKGISTIRVEANQGTAAVLVANGQARPAKQIVAPIIGGRPMLVRGYWKLDPGWQQRPILAVLTVSQQGGTVTTFTDTKMVKPGGPAPNSGAVPMAGAFNWFLEASQVRVGMAFSIELFESTSPPGAPPSSAPRLPATGEIAIKVDDRPSELSIVVIPAAVGGRAPSATPAEIEKLRDFLFDVYPVQKVTVDVRDPTPARGVKGTSTNAPIWAAMDKICRQDERTLGSRAGVIYQMMIERPQTMITYGGHSMGSPQRMTDPCMTKNYVMVGYTRTHPAGVAANQTVTYANSIAAKPDSNAHEFGHNHNRYHIACGGAGNATPDFPYKNGSIGTQGYRLSFGPPKPVAPRQQPGPRASVQETQGLYHVGEWHDLMGYCMERWISDWQFKGLHQKTTLYTKWARAKPRQDRSGRSLVGYVGPGEHSWLNVPGNRVDARLHPTPDKYARVWVSGMASARLPISVTQEDHGPVKGVVFALPEGRLPERAEVVLGGVRVSIDMASIEHL